MTTEEARELRAVVAEGLAPIHAACLGNIPHADATARVRDVLNRMDAALAAVEHAGGAQDPAHACNLYRAALARADIAVNAGVSVDGLEIPALRRKVAELDVEVRRLTGELARATSLHCTICGTHHGGQYSAPAAWSHVGPGQRPKGKGES